MYNIYNSERIFILVKPKKFYVSICLLVRGFVRMRYNIISLDLEESYVSQMEENKEVYNYFFKNFTCSKNMIDFVKDNENIELLIGIDIDSDPDGKYKLCTHLKCYTNVTVIFLSQYLNAEDRMRWLNFGALSYIYKPFRFDELIIRTISLIDMKQNKILVDENFVINFHTNVIEYNGTELKVTPAIYNLIVYLVEHPGQYITREMIMSEVLDTKDFLNVRNVDTLIKELRKYTNKDVIRTVYGVGYFYNPKNKKFYTHIALKTKFYCHRFINISRIISLYE